MMLVDFSKNEALGETIIQFSSRPQSAVGTKKEVRWMGFISAVGGKHQPRNISVNAGICVCKAPSFI